MSPNNKSNTQVAVNNSAKATSSISSIKSKKTSPSSNGNNNAKPIVISTQLASAAPDDAKTTIDNIEQISTSLSSTNSLSQPLSTNQCPPTVIQLPNGTTKPITNKLSPISIVDFYRKRSVLITGGSGFVGKVLIEKLLYEFRDIDKVYLLLRPKSGQMIKQRLQQMTESPVFNRIRGECPEQFQKLIAISGDVGYPRLGLNPIDQGELIENVSVIFHSAATIRFDEPLRYALEINTIGTKRMIQLAQKLNNLAAFVHVSTAYCTVQKYNIEERIYLEPILPDRIIEMAEWMDDETLNNLAPMLYRGRPSSYHYTKSLAENLVALEVHNGYRPPFGHQVMLDSSTPPPERIPFPAAIIRPSIITASWKDPYPGWIDNYNGTTGFLVVCGKGVLRTVHCTKSYLCDLIPVDVVINTCIASAWHVHCNLDKGGWMPPPADQSTGQSNVTNQDPAIIDDVFVVNCCSSHLNPVSWGELYDISYPFFFKYPSNEMFRVPGVRYHRHQLLHQLNVYLEHQIPSYVVDFIFKFTGYPPILDLVYQKVHRASTAFEHFTTNEWTYQGSNLLLLSQAIKDCCCQSMEAESARIEIAKNGTIPCTSTAKSMSNGGIHKANVLTRNPFPIDLRELSWNSYIEDYILGIRQFLLKEDPATIPDARNQLLLIRALTTTAKVVTTGTVAYQLLNPNSLTRKCLHLMRAYLQSRRRPLGPGLSSSGALLVGP